MNCEARNHYVYMHRRADTGGVFYVGLGSGYNYARARTLSSRNAHWTAVNTKHGRTVEIVSDNLTAEEAAAIEFLAIFRLRRKGVKLTNMAHGGSIGRLGAKWTDAERASRLSRHRSPRSDEWKAERSADMRAKYSDGKHPGIGSHRTPEQCARFSAAKTGDKNPMWGKTPTAEHRAKLSAAGRKRAGIACPALKKPRDMTVHVFAHPDLGEWRGLQYDFAEFSGLRRQGVNALIKGRKASWRKWTYKGSEV